MIPSTFFCLSAAVQDVAAFNSMVYSNCSKTVKFGISVSVVDTIGSGSGCTSQAAVMNYAEPLCTYQIARLSW